MTLAENNYNSLYYYYTKNILSIPAATKEYPSLLSTASRISIVHFSSSLPEKGNVVTAVILIVCLFMYQLRIDPSRRPDQWPVLEMLECSVQRESQNGWQEMGSGTHWYLA